MNKEKAKKEHQNKPKQGIQGGLKENDTYFA